MTKHLKAVACVQDNGPNYWIVTTGEWKAPVIATCGLESDAQRIAACLNNSERFDELRQALASIANRKPETVSRYSHMYDQGYDDGLNECASIASKVLSEK